MNAINVKNKNIIMLAFIKVISVLALKALYEMLKNSFDKKYLLYRFYKLRNYKIAQQKLRLEIKSNIRFLQIIKSVFEDKNS